MGLHSSLKRTEKLGSGRSVMKRTERIKWLIEKGQWDKEARVLGLPKIKIVKLKTIKKEKVKEEGEEAKVEGAVNPTAKIETKPAAAKPAAKSGKNK